MVRNNTDRQQQTSDFRFLFLVFGVVKAALIFLVWPPRLLPFFHPSKKHNNVVLSPIYGVGGDLQWETSLRIMALIGRW